MDQKGQRLSIPRKKERAIPYSCDTRKCAYYPLTLFQLWNRLMHKTDRHLGSVFEPVFRNGSARYPFMT